MFTLTARNDGPNAAANVVVTDKLPTGLTYVSDDSGGKYNSTTGLWTVGALAKGATATLKITVKGTTEGDYVNAVTALTSDTTNTKPVCTDAADPSTCPNAKLSVHASDLVMTAATAPNPVAPGATSTATLTVTNNGPSTTAAPATVTFTLPQRTTPGATLPAGCTAAADKKSVTCTVPAGLAKSAKADFAIPLVVDSDAPVSTALTGGTVTVASTDDTNTANNTAAVPLSTTAKASNDLVMSVSAPSTPVTPGTTTTVTGTVTNNGPSDTTSASTVTFTLPANTTAAATQPAGCTVAVDKKSVSCTIAAGLKNAATSAFAISVLVDPAAPLGTVLSGGNAAVVNSDDPLATNNSVNFQLTTTATATADLSITKKASGTTAVVPGSTFTYDLVVSNAGPSQATNVTVTDALPVVLTFVSSDAGCTASGQTVTCGPIATLGAGATKTVKLTVKLDPAYSGDGSDIKNQATVKSDATDPDTTNNTSDAGTGGLPGPNPQPGPTPNPPAKPSADLSITKKAVGTTAVAPGQSFVYDLTVSNAGPSQAKNVVVTDTLPSPLRFQPSAGCTASGQTVTCDPVAVLEVGATRVFKVTVQLDPAYAGDGSDIRNQASVKSDTADPVSTNNTSDAATGGLPGPGPVPNPPAKPSADLAITKKPVGTTAVVPGGTFDYTITVTNAGPSQAKNVVVTDALPSQLSFVSADTGCAASGQTVTCTGPATLDPGKSQSYKVTVRLDQAYGGDGSDIRNQASVKSDTADPVAANNTSDAATGGLPGPGPVPNPPAKPSADLAITKKPVGTTPVVPGGTFDYTVTVTNAGPSQAKNVVVTDALPSVLAFVSADAGCTAAGQTVTCTGPATLDVGKSQAYKITVKLDAAYSGDGSDIRNQASVKSDTADPVPANNTSDAGTGGLPGPNPQPGPTPNPPAKPSADLAITKAPVGTTPVVPGGTFDYTITVTNNGLSQAKNVVVTDTLPTQLHFVSADTGCAASGQTVTCTGPATLDPKATQVYKVTVRLDQAYAGDGSDIRNQASVKSDTADPDTSNNTSDAATGGLPGPNPQPGPTPNPPAPASADLAITKKPVGTTPVVAGGTFDYELTVTNKGLSQAKNVVVTDALQAELHFVSADAGCAASGQTVTCTGPATLVVGGTQVYKVTVRLDQAYAGDGSDIRNQASVKSDTADPDTSNNTSDAGTGGLPGPGPGPNPPAPASADLAITKKPVGTTLVAPGESFDYELTVTNKGLSQAKNVVVTDALPSQLRFVSADTGCTAAGQTVTCTGPATLDVGKSQVYKVTVRLDQAYAGDGSDIRNTASVKSDTADPDTSNNTSDAGTGGLPGPGPGPNPPAVTKADLAITKKAVGTAPVVPGTNFSYELTVTNNGPSQAKNVVVTDALPSVLAFVSADAGCAASGQTVTCTGPATLDVGKTQTYKITVKLDPAYSGDGSDIRNQASVKSDTADPVSANNTSDAATGGLPGPGPGPNPPAPASADLAITKRPVGTTLVVPGTTYDYEITVTNNGPSQARNVVVADALPAQLAFVSSADGCTASGQDVTCGPLVTMDPKAVKVYKVTVRLDRAYAGDGSDIRNQASVKSDTADPDMSNNTSDAGTGGLPGPGPGPNPPAPASADLAIAKKPVGTTPVVPGTDFSYELTVTNKGPSQAKSVVVTDVLQAELHFVSVDAGCAAAGQTVTCTGPATLDPKGTQTYKITVKLDAAYAGDGSDIRNQASVKSDTADPDMSNNTSDAGTGGLPGPGPVPNPPAPASADLAITKKPVGTTPVVAGGTFEYEITVTNNGPSQAKNVVVTDALPSQLHFVSADSACTASGQEVTCGPLATMDPKATQVYKVTVRLDQAYAGDGSDIRNTASVKSDTADPVPANNTSDAATGGLPGPGPGPNPPAPASADLAITKKPVGTTSVAPGESFDYELTVTNNGPSQARNVVVTDALPSVLAFVSADAGCAVSGQTVTCIGPATLDVGKTLAYKITVKLDAAYSGDGSDIRNQASVKSDTADPVPANNTSDAVTGGLPGPGPGPNPPSPAKADLAVTKKPVGTAPVVPGTDFSYEITVTNNGPSQASNVVVTDALPSQLAFVSSADGCTASGRDVTCGPLATMDPKGTRTYRITVKLDAAYAGNGSDIRNLASVKSDTADPDTSNNTSDAATGGLPGPGPGPNPPAPASADLAITKKPVGTTPVVAGGTFEYEITVTNNGPSQARNVVVTDALPSQLAFVSSADGCTASGRDVTCGPLATMDPKGTRTYRITVKLDAAYAGNGSDIRNLASVKSDTADPDTSNNTSDAATGGLPGPGPGPNPPAPASADLAITKKPVGTTPVVAGGTFEYEITVTNNGPSQARNVVVTDALPSQLAFVSSADGCTASGRDVTCGPLATMDPKAVKVYKVTVRLDQAYAGDGADIRNQASVKSDTADPDTSNNTSDAAMGGLPGPNPQPGPNPNPPAPASADLAIAKKAVGTAPVVPGTDFSYELTVTNNGPSQARNVSVTDNLPGVLAFVSADAGCAASGQTVTCTGPATLDVGKTRTYKITVKLDAAYSGDGSDIRNQASVKSDTADPVPANNTSDAGTGGLPGPGPGPNPPAPASADLAITKKPVGTTPVVAGGTFEYEITVTNNGPSQAKNVTVTDNLPTQLHFVSADTGCVVSGQTVTCGPLATMDPKGTRTYKITVQLDAAYSGDGSDIRNQASVKSDTADPDMSNNTSDAGTGGLPGPGPGPNPPAPASADLAIVKKPVGTTPVVAGGTFEYEITVTNKGLSQARNVVVTDALPSQLQFVSADAGCGVSGQTVTCTGPATLDPKGTQVYKVTVRLDQAYAGDGSDIRNTASVKSDTADPDMSNNTSDAGTGGLPGPGPVPNPPAPASADLAITKKPVGTTLVAPGESFDYELTVTNKGLSQAKNVVVTDALPSQLRFVSADTGCTAAGQTVTCTGPATLDVGKSQVYKVTVRLDQAYAGDGSDIRNTASVKSDTADPDTSNNTSDAGTGGLPGPGPGPNPPAVTKADLAITKKAVGTAPVVPGTDFSYELTVTNNGPSQAKNVVVTDALPSVLAFVSADAGCAASGQTVTCTGPATLDVGKTQTYKITVKLDPAYSGDGSDIRNTASVKSDTADPVPANNTSDAATGGLPGPGPGPNPPAPASADLAIVKKPVGTTPVVAGGTFEYEITVTNNGPSQAKNVVVTDVLQAELHFVSADAGCGAAGRTVTCTGPATLDPKGTQVYKVTVRLDQAYGGNGSDIRNTASVKSDTADPDMSNNTSDAGTGGLPGPGPGPNPPAPTSADLAITKKPVGTTLVAPGESFDYELTVTNKGLSQARNVVVTDALQAELHFVSADAGCVASGQTVTCAGPATLDVGKTQTYKVTVRLDQAYVGNGSDIRNQASVKSDTADPDTSNNTSDAATGGLPGPGPGPNPPAVTKADLAITKKAVGTAPVVPGTDFSYELTVTNNGPSQAKNVSVTDNLPGVLAFVSADSGCTGTGRMVICTGPATLDVGKTRTYKITVKLDAGYSGDGSDIRNQASVKSDTADPDMSNNTSDAGTGGLPGPGPGPNPPAPASADLAIVKKTANDTRVSPGATFDYAFTVTNNGPSRALGVVVTDPLPAPLAFVSSADGCTAAGQNVVCPRLVELAVGASRTYTITVRLDADYDGDGSEIRNTARVAADTADPVSANNSSQAGLPGGKPARGVANLAVEKKSTGPQAAPGETVPYTITVTNKGPSNDAYQVVLADKLPAPLSYVSSQPAGCVLDSASRTVRCPVKNRLRVGEKFSYTLLLRLDPGYTGDGSDVLNTATVSGDNLDPDTADNTSTAPLPDNGRPAPPKRDLAVTATVGADSVTPGGTVQLRTVIRNLGPSATSGRGTHTVTLPEGVTFTGQAPAGCAFESPARAVCTVPAQLVPGGNAEAGAQTDSVAYEFTLRLSADAGHGAVVLGDASVDEPDDQVSRNNSAPFTIRAKAPAADLALTKQAAYPAGKSQVDPGDTFTYTLTAVNNGPSTAVNVKVGDPLPAALAFVSSPDGCTANGQTVSCGPLARLAVGAKAVYRITVKLDPKSTGRSVDNIATVSADTADPDQANNSNKPGTTGPDGGILHTGEYVVLPEPLPHTGADRSLWLLGWAAALTGLGSLLLAATALVRRRRP
ncbi:DUF11 domain-containing protein [Kitasatospora sp. MMS16-BH015]|uniref:DUF11 domain-containing protein n=1 Tax=Kitasatospora sp. MMS16-BH015 TaxID=2018025 RepID=UPI0020C4B96F|nr:DUF11 domain-containing protein [Kitasatospora sp. MMS16-BH015]